MASEFVGSPNLSGLEEALQAPLPLLTLTNQPVFPGAGVALHVERPRNRALIESLGEGTGRIVLAFAAKDMSQVPNDRDDLMDVGVAARILAIEARDQGEFIVTIEGIARVTLTDLDTDGPFFRAGARTCGDESAPVTPEAMEALRASAKRLIASMPELPDMLVDVVDQLSADILTNLIGAHLNTSFDDKVQLLTELDLTRRSELAVEILERQMALKERLLGLSGRPLKQVWPLEDDAAQRRREAVEAGRITESEARELEEFATRGYIVLEKAVEEELVDALVRDVRSIREHPGAFVTTDHRRGRGYRLSDETFDSYESIFDLYINFESARKVCFHPRIIRFLELVFEEKPVAFQQLLFQRSNLHPMHQDTAYVCVEDPLLLVASWIALEDVVPGRGELTYMDGSHRIPHRFFADGSKRFDPDHDDESAARAYLAEATAAAGCEQRDFHAKKGDALLWAADLVHGSRPRTRPEEETRLSCVTHYCPESSDPLWAWKHPQHRKLHPFGDRTFVASSYYREIGGSQMQRPSPHAPLPI